MAGPVLLNPTKRELLPRMIETRGAASIHDSSHACRDMEKALSASAAGLGCARGTTLALGFEVAVVLGIYALWHVLRLFY